MKTFLKGFFLDDTGAPSMMRGIQFICVLATLMLAVVIVNIALNTQPLVLDSAGVKTIVPADTSVIKELIFFALAVLGITTTGKFVQSFAERNITTDSKPETKP